MVLIAAFNALQRRNEEAHAEVRGRGLRKPRLNGAASYASVAVVAVPRPASRVSLTAGREPRSIRLEMQPPFPLQTQPQHLPVEPVPFADFL